jgi:hypothetical protein
MDLTITCKTDRKKGYAERTGLNLPTNGTHVQLSYAVVTDCEGRMPKLKLLWPQNLNQNRGKDG